MTLEEAIQQSGEPNGTTLVYRLAWKSLERILAIRIGPHRGNDSTYIKWIDYMVVCGVNLELRIAGSDFSVPNWCPSADDMAATDWAPVSADEWKQAQEAVRTGA